MSTDSVPSPPVTGHAVVDAALSALGDPSALTPAQRLEAITVAHEALHRALHLDEGV